MKERVDEIKTLKILLDLQSKIIEIMLLRDNTSIWFKLIVIPLSRLLSLINWHE